MKGLTAPGLRRLPSSIPTARLERLRLDEPSRDAKFSATDWVAFLKQLECQDNLKRLDLASKKFGAGAKALGGTKDATAQSGASAAPPPVQGSLRLTQAYPAPS